MLEEPYSSQINRFFPSLWKVSLDVNEPSDGHVDSPTPQDSEANLNKQISEVVGFSVQTRNAFQHAGIMTIRDLVSRTDVELLKMWQFGKKSLKTVHQILGQLGLKTGMRLE